MTEKVCSTQLLPGDLIRLEENVQLPCDVALLVGQCVMNESSLTGESVPVVKDAIPWGEEVYRPDSAAHAKYTIYGGTSVLQVTSRGGQVVGHAIMLAWVWSASNGPEL
ncbi:MAG: hypothetical protein J0M20_11265 [Burkholderiales bacterium]|nr:hypothetical protein [Burkholderiales bacterium]